MPNSSDRFDEDLERLLVGDADASPDRMQDPLLRLSLELRDRLAPGAAPDPEFRARLKAELLEKFADNVRPFPAQAATVTPIGRWRRVRRAAIAAVLATAASIALVVGYTDLRAHVDTSGSKLAQVAGPSATPHGATPQGVRSLPTDTPQPSDTASPVVPTSTRAHPVAATPKRTATHVPIHRVIATPRVVMPAASPSERPPTSTVVTKHAQVAATLAPPPTATPTITRATDRDSNHHRATDRDSDHHRATDRDSNHCRATNANRDHCRATNANRDHCRATNANRDHCRATNANRDHCRAADSDRNRECGAHRHCQGGAARTGRGHAYLGTRRSYRRQCDRSVTDAHCSGANEHAGPGGEYRYACSYGYSYSFATHRYTDRACHGRTNDAAYEHRSTAHQHHRRDHESHSAGVGDGYRAEGDSDGATLGYAGDRYRRAGQHCIAGCHRDGHA